MIKYTITNYALNNPKIYNWNKYKKFFSGLVIKHEQYLLVDTSVFSIIQSL